MLRGLLARSLTLDLTGGSLRVRSPRDLELALNARTALSSLRIAALGGLSDEALVHEQDAIENLEQQIVQVLSHPPTSGGNIGRFLSELDLSRIADDNDWRGLFEAVRHLDGSYEDYKKATLLKYIAYLASGKEFLRTIRSNRQPKRAQPPRAGGGAEDASVSDLGPRQRLIYDLEDLPGGDRLSGATGEEFNRMPKGVTLEIEFVAHQSMSLMLAKYRFTIVAGSPYLLIDDNGNDYRLRAGKSIIGRSAQCDVAVDPIYRAISRRHLIVEADAGGRVTLTDISTLGTFVPRAYLDNRLH